MTTAQCGTYLFSIVLCPELDTAIDQLHLTVTLCSSTKEPAKFIREPATNQQTNSEGGIPRFCQEYLPVFYTVEGFQA